MNCYIREYCIKVCCVVTECFCSAPGNIIDWMYADANVIFSYSLMLRDAGTVGFVPSILRSILRLILIC